MTALQGSDRKRLLRLAAPGDAAARRQLDVIYHNVKTIGLTDLSLHYVGEDESVLDAAEERRLDNQGHVVDVQLGWRIAGFDEHPSRREITLTLRDGPRQAWFASARDDHGMAVPLWMLTRLRVARGHHAMAMVAVGQDPRRFARLASRAVAHDHRVLHGWDGPLVVEVPASQQQLDRVFDAAPTAYREIAALTTTVDGSDRRAAPVHVFVNPKVFDTLGPIGSQVVVSHEATHVAMHAAISDMSSWLLEGFADYVALDHVDLSVTTSASQILAQVRRHGPPLALPGARQFSAENPALGAQYEASWLACRLIATTYGERRLIAFYRQADRDSSTETAFPEVLGTTQIAFTHAWRRYLRRLAG